MRLIMSALPAVRIHKYFRNICSLDLGTSPRGTSSSGQLDTQYTLQLLHRSHEANSFTREKRLYDICEQKIGACNPCITIEYRYILNITTYQKLQLLHMSHEAISFTRERKLYDICEQKIGACRPCIRWKSPASKWYDATYLKLTFRNEEQ